MAAVTRAGRTSPRGAAASLPAGPVFASPVSAGVISAAGTADVSDVSGGTATAPGRPARPVSGRHARPAARADGRPGSAAPDIRRGGVGLVPARPGSHRPRRARRRCHRGGNRRIGHRVTHGVGTRIGQRGRRRFLDVTRGRRFPRRPGGRVSRNRRDDRGRAAETSPERQPRARIRRRRTGERQVRGHPAGRPRANGKPAAASDAPHPPVARRGPQPDGELPARFPGGPCRRTAELLDR